jgi:hypothetical protein
MKLTKMMAVSALILVAGFWVLTTSEFQHYKGLPGDKTDQYWWRHWIGGKNYGIGLIWAVSKSAAFGKGVAGDASRQQLSAALRTRL